MFFESSQEMTLQTKASLVISMAVPVLTEKASDAVSHICAFQKQAHKASESQVKSGTDAILLTQRNKQFALKWQRAVTFEIYQTSWSGTFQQSACLSNKSDQEAQHECVHT